MKSIIKLSVAALLVVGSTQASANDGQLDITQTLSNSIAQYIESTSNELQSKLKQSLFSDSQKMLTELFSQQSEQSAEVGVAENTSQLVATSNAVKVEG
ncbi:MULTISPECIES: hypothetical protein [unclassified Pseudoalteromonas]|jgi:hypothetical protein|uniref:hypothetical protein n=1 Tax=Pseudoalteromonas TaxID=53246 RepID=UPI001600A3EE|nr:MULTISPECIES: hypothetical protein [unclassified Pseudoalteromonas]MBB1293469.1 hypothetical protein [Pseudoalteromonas sp. SR41-4]MBB1505078.1 hypothetical protein [Pseudoalteromonas sp. SG41-1]